MNICCLKHLDKWALLFLGVSLFGADLSAQERQVPNGRWVAEQVDGRNVGDDVERHMSMTLIDKRGTTRHRSITSYRKEYGSVSKLFLRFEDPKDIAGTSFLVWERKGTDNERFLYLPALRRVRRISSKEQEENFAGTDFSYEDIAGRELDNYTYELLEEETVRDGIPCYLMASHSKNANSKFPKILSWVRKDNFVVIAAEYFDRKEVLVKTYSVEHIKRLEGIWTRMRYLMKDLKTGHQTTVGIEKNRYNKGIADRRFDKRMMKQK